MLTMEPDVGTVAIDLARWMRPFLLTAGAQGERLACPQIPGHDAPALPVASSELGVRHLRPLQPK